MTVNSADGLAPLVHRHALLLPALLVLSLSLMKFRLAGVPLSDLGLLGIAAIFFLKYGRLLFTLQTLSFSFFAALSLVLAFFTRDVMSLASAVKLFVTLFALISAHKYFSRLTAIELYQLTKMILLTLALSQVIIVILFYSQQFSFLFHLVEPGNINRDEAGFRINVYIVPLLDFYRFGSVFVEPSWFAFFTGFFLLLLFYLDRKLDMHGVNFIHHAIIIAAFIFTLSFTGFTFMLVAYLYRFFDKRYPLRLVFAVPLIVVLLAWVLLTNEYLAHRIYLIASGKDASFNARIFASWDKTMFILWYTDFIGAGPGKPIELINQFFHINLSIQNAYLESLAATGIFGLLLFVTTMHFSWLLYPSFMLQLPLILALLISSVVFTPIYWVLAFYLYHVARSLQQHAFHSSS